MQDKENGLLDQIFVKQMEHIYSDDVGDRYCYQIIFNSIKNIVIETCLKKVIKSYKHNIIRFLPGTGDETTELTTTLVVLNDWR